MKEAIIFVTGAGIGAFTAWFLTKANYEKRLDTEIEDVKSHYSNKYQATKPSEPINESSEELVETLKEAVEEAEYHDYSKHSKKPQKAVKPAIKSSYIISLNEFAEPYDDYDKTTMTYYSGDNTFVDEDDNILNENQVLTILGDYKNLQSVGEYENGVVYIRNDSLGTDYEIIVEETTYL